MGTAGTALSRAGGGNRDRTGDLLHAMQALSQLSYTPNRARNYSKLMFHLQSPRNARTRECRASGVAAVAGTRSPTTRAMRLNGRSRHGLVIAAPSLREK